MTRVIAVDLGATSIRVADVDVEDPAPEPRILHRAPNRPLRDAGGTLRWDWTRLVQAVHAGIAAARARTDGGAIASIGVDSWGVDYGLLDDAGRLISAPVSYRDERTAGWRTTADAIGLGELFRRTGLEPAAMNTMFQLAVHDPGELARARHVLLLP
jgi:rhamnulokinase